MIISLLFFKTGAIETCRNVFMIDNVNKHEHVRKHMAHSRHIDEHRISLYL